MRIGLVITLAIAGISFVLALMWNGPVYTDVTMESLIFYSRDTRTDLCFAWTRVYGDRSVTHVPCSPAVLGLVR